MDHKEEERQRGQMTAEKKSVMGSSSKPGGFRNDPDDPSNPNQCERRTCKKFGRYSPLDIADAILLPDRGGSCDPRMQVAISAVLRSGEATAGEILLHRSLRPIRRVPRSNRTRSELSICCCRHWRKSIARFCYSSRSRR